MPQYQIPIIGGGIVGLATARALVEIYPGIDPAEWAHRYRHIGSLTPQQFRKLQKKACGARFVKRLEFCAYGSLTFHKKTRIGTGEHRRGDRAIIASRVIRSIVLHKYNRFIN